MATSFIRVSLRPRHCLQFNKTLHVARSSVLTNESLESRCEKSLILSFPNGAERVIESFRRLQRDEDFRKDWPGLGIQEAASYIEGLTATPFPDKASPGYEWLNELEMNAHIIQDEFQSVMQSDRLLREGVSVWAVAARTEAVSYGPDWRTLVLQDRGMWEETNRTLFPKTCRLISDVKAPSMEVFFAKQKGGTGIATHTDDTNFICTAHLGLIVPEGKCWIDAGSQRKYWENGKAFVCDTSFLHGTMNASEEDRYVLIVRFWHPELSIMERLAIQYLFDMLDDPTMGGFEQARQNMLARKQAIVKRTDGRKSKRISTATPIRAKKGFGMTE